MIREVEVVMEDKDIINKEIIMDREVGMKRVKEDHPTMTTSSQITIEVVITIEEVKTIITINREVAAEAIKKNISTAKNTPNSSINQVKNGKEVVITTTSINKADIIKTTGITSNKMTSIISSKDTTKMMRANMINNLTSSSSQTTKWMTIIKRIAIMMVIQMTECTGTLITNTTKDMMSTAIIMTVIKMNMEKNAIPLQ